MNTSLVTTGLVPLTIGSTETFGLQPTLDGVPWSMQGGTVTLILSDPNSVQTTIPAVIQPGPDGFYTARAPWTVAGTVGQWTRAWKIIVGSLVQVSRALPFAVTSSP